MLKGILQFAHELLQESIHKGDTVIDATCGNGNDTLFLSELVGQDGNVYAFDIQDQAIKNSIQLMESRNRKNVAFIHDSHANIANHLPDGETIGGAIFNLGYLPRSDKSIITRGDTTIKAIASILQGLKKDGLIVLVIYHGHEGGKAEKDAVLEYVMRLDQQAVHVLQYGFINQRNYPPFVIAIQKRY